MALPKFDSFELNTDNYYISDITYRSIPKRNIQLEDISRKPGKKLISEEFGERTIRMSGHIVGDDADDLQDKIDDLHTNITRKTTGVLYIDSDRYINAIVSSITISDPHYNQSITPMELEFIAADPFFLGAEQTVIIPVAEGTGSIDITLTVSGSIFAEPTIIYKSGGQTGNFTSLYKISINYENTSEYVTWSGGSDTLARNISLDFDYANQIITEDTTEVEAAGVFSRLEPGTANLQVDFYSTSTSSTTTSTSSTTTSSSTTQTGTSTSTTRSTSTSTTTTLLAIPQIEISYKPRYL